MDQREADDNQPEPARGFLKELARRHVVQIAIAYSVGAWVVVEIASVVLPAFNAPDWALQGAILLAVLGFPVALVVSWVFDITPQGLRRTDDVDEEKREARAAARRLASERRQITVLNLRLGWVCTDDDIDDAEEIRDALGAYAARVGDIVERHGGIVYRTASQQIIVCFGYPDAHEDDARRAAKTAMAIVADTAAFNQAALAGHKPQTSLRIGIDTDTAVVESVDDEKPRLVGRLLERAEWLSTVAVGGSADGGIVVSDASHRLLGGYFELEHLGDAAQVKGRAETPVYALTRQGRLRSRLEIRGGLTGLVGRAPELALLSQRWEQAEDGQGQVVIVSGEAGLGKSRLVHELKLKVSAQRDAGIVELFCFADYQNSVLHPVRELFRSRLETQLEIAGTDDRITALEQLLAGGGRNLSEAVPLMVDLLGLEADDRYPPMQLAAPLQKSRTLELLLGLLLQPESDGPLLLLIDDYHWADSTFRELIEALVSQGPGLRALIVITTRPEGVPDWIDRSHVTQISISPLTTSETKALVSAIAEEAALPEKAVEQLVRNAQGNPLFAEELTRGVLDVDGSGADADAGVDAGDLDIPLTLQESLLARLDRLTFEAKTVVRLAATIGRQFDYDLSSAFAEELGIEDFELHLQQLVAADIIYQRGLPPNASYSFRHVLIQEAAYQSILKREREDYHRRIAALLQQRFPDACTSSPEVPARHLTSAGMVSEAIPLWLQAGRLAARKAAHQEACNLLRYAVSLLEKLPASAERDAMELDIQIALGPSLMASRGYSAQGVREAYSRAEQLANKAESTLAIAPVLFGLWTHHVVAGNLTRAMELGTRLRSIAETSGSEDLLLESHVLLGVTQSYIGPMKESLSNLSVAAGMYDGERHANHAYIYGQDPKMASLSYSAIPHWWLGRTMTASGCVEDAISHARRIDHPRSLAFALANGARAELKRGEYLRCVEIGAEAADISQKHGYPDFLWMGRFHRCAAEYRMGEGENAVEALQESLRELIAVGNSLSVPYYCSVAADVLSAEGEFDAALAQLAHAKRELEKHGQDLDAAEVHRVRGVVEWRQSLCDDCPPELQPETSLRRAHDLADRQGALSWRLLAAVSLGEFLAERDRPDEARSLVSAALDAMPEKGHLPVFNDASRLLDDLS